MKIIWINVNMTPRKTQCYHSDPLGVALAALSRTEFFKQQNRVPRKFVFSFVWFLCFKKMEKSKHLPDIYYTYCIHSTSLLFYWFDKNCRNQVSYCHIFFGFFSPKNVLIRFLFEESAFGFVHWKRLWLLFSSMCFSFVYAYSEKLYLIH